MEDKLFVWRSGIIFLTDCQTWMDYSVDFALDLF